MDKPGRFYIDNNGRSYWSVNGPKSESKTTPSVNGNDSKGPAPSKPKAPKVKKPAQKVSYDRVKCEDLLKRKFFYTPSFDIYGGVAGFYDFGPLGSALKANLEAQWRKHFILEEDMLELTCTCMTLSDVLIASGHRDKFEDFMVKDVKTGQGHRADKLIEEGINKIIQKKKKKIKPEELAKYEKILNDCENYNAEQMDQCIQENKLKAPDTGNDLGPAEPFNLMFSSKIGPSGYVDGYLRPETAQGIFLNFKKLNEFNNGRMPFSGAQIGLGFRNEIHPRAGLLRVREFQMAEIEHFVDPNDKTYPKFFMQEDIKLPLLTADNQEQGGPIIKDLTLKQAVENGVIGNETLAYFMARTYLFLTQNGIHEEGVRFRQHRSNEMAHYAQDCWDAEVECSYGWIEVAGHSDRSCYDLEAHAKYTNTKLEAARPLKEPIKVNLVRVSPDAKLLGKDFKKDGNVMKKYLEALSEDQKKELAAEMEANKKIKIKIEDKEWELADKYVKFEAYEHTIMEEKFVPHVIEPSYGLGRIMYCIFEHCFRSREQDAQRTYFDFPIQIAPIKCSILPLISKPELDKKVFEMKMLMNQAGISSKVDDTGVSVGKRYARTDECGIPFAFTVDFDTVEKNLVTMRQLDTMTQTQLPMNEAPRVILEILNGYKDWDDVIDEFGLFTSSAAE